MPRFICREPRAFTQEAAAALLPYEGFLAQLLYARGIETCEEAEAFLNPCPEQLLDPKLLFGLVECMEFFEQARQDGKRIVVYGDYDADGICASAILSTALNRYGIPTDTHTPLRAEGYGLNIPAIDNLRKQYDILVTVDLGITNHEEVRYAQTIGMPVIVTDHHRIENGESPADVVVHPALGNYPCPKLCGTGVAFKLAQGLLGYEGCRDLLDLAALGTVADLVPLTGENRVIVALGLPLIGERKRPGIKALLESARWDKEVASDTVAYQLAPRLNSTGRMGNAQDGIDLLLTQDEMIAAELAQKIEGLNESRKREENEVVSACEKQVGKHDFISEWAVMVRGENWNAGVVGLAAGRLMQHYGCPSCVLTRTGDNQLSGSLRSVPGINIHQCLMACDDLLLRYGGHKAAAGVTLLESNYEAFRERLQREIMKADPSCFLPRQEYDIQLYIADLNESLLASLERMAPFGLGNPAPLLASFGIHLDERRAVGDGSHLKLTLRQNTAVMDGIAFGKGKLASRLSDTADVVYTLGRNTFRGITSLQISVNAIASEENARRQMILNQSQETECLSLLRAFALLPEEKDIPKAIEEDQQVGFEKLEFLMRHLERGHLLVSRSAETAEKLLKLSEDLFLNDDENPQLFPHLWLHPDRKDISDQWRHIWLVDGILAREELAFWYRLCPNAILHVFPQNPKLSMLAAVALPSKDDMRKVYITIRNRVCSSPQSLAKACDSTLLKTKAALTALQEAGLIHLREVPFTLQLIQKGKADPCELSLTWRRLQSLSLGESHPAF